MAGVLSKLKQALIKTSSQLGQGIDHLFIKRKLDNDTLEKLEDLLLLADVGNHVASEIINKLRQQKFDKEVKPEEIRQDLSQIISELLDRQDHQFTLLSEQLNIILVCGVNGNGKTTTIGKMADNYIKTGKKVAIAACDTFRAAAVEQIEQWAEKTGADLYKGGHKTDPASVVHKAIDASLHNGTDILFVDTAGRLHNDLNLMQELAKIIRVIKKHDQNAPHHSLLVIDGTTGQNAVVQVEKFKQVADISGLVITKLDGTAKAGVAIGIVNKFNLPIYFIGIGEKVDDLKEFSSQHFAQALVGV